MLGVQDPGEVHLICGPLYHSQPVGFGSTALGAGHRVVMMEGGFDAEAWLSNGLRPLPVHVFTVDA